MANPATVVVESVAKRYGRGEAAVLALDDISLTIAGGSFFTLLGPSGCGKTTLLRALAGFETPSAGRILLDGQDITALPPNKRPINTVFQSYALFPHLSVQQNVAFGLKMLGRPKSEIGPRVDEMLALVRMDHLAGRNIAQLSGGQQQRVALARALAPQPRVLLLDEPLSALDLKLRREMQTELKRLQRETGITFVFVTHDQEEALTMSDGIAVMSAGRIQQIGSPRQIYAQPANRFVAGFIGDSNFLPARIEGRDAILPGLRLGLTEDHPQGAAVLAIRPEDLRLAVPGSAPQHGLPALAGETVYLGNALNITAILQDGTELVVRQPASYPAPDLGSAITLELDPRQLRVLEAEG